MWRLQERRGRERRLLQASSYWASGADVSACSLPAASPGSRRSRWDSGPAYPPWASCQPRPLSQVSSQAARAGVHKAVTSDGAVRTREDDRGQGLERWRSGPDGLSQSSRYLRTHPSPCVGRGPRRYLCSSLFLPAVWCFLLASMRAGLAAAG